MGFIDDYLVLASIITIVTLWGISATSFAIENSSNFGICTF